ncbi:MAG TPA: CoA-binding protein [Anaerolineae bacterium]|mgnify:FL=1|nr:CoA-binding protein [Anaerolineae bacterium]
MLNDTELKAWLERLNTVAVVGMSTNPTKAAHRVPAYLLTEGFEVIPVNPHAETILERRCYRSLLDVPESIDIVEVFRPSEDALPVVEEALARHTARGDVALIWLQLGIVNETARARAEAAGIPFVQDRCMAIEIPRLFPGGRVKR